MYVSFSLGKDWERISIRRKHESFGIWPHWHGMFSKNLSYQKMEIGFPVAADKS